jgi:CRP-like cAMP-binding protein
MAISAGVFRERFPKLAQHCNDEELNALLKALIVEEIPAGQVVLKENEYCDTLYLVMEGLLNAQITSDGNVILFSTIEQGGSFCEVSLLDPGEATSTVIAVEKCTLLSLTHDTFHKLDKQYPEMTGNILRMLSLMLVERCRAADKVLFSRYDKNDGSGSQ